MSFQQALSGLNASSTSLKAIGNNIANTSTVGFKSSSAQFADAFAASMQGGGTSAVGIGASVSGVAQLFTQGNLTSTNNPLDIAINGGGMFRLDNNGTITYTRNGQYLLDREGYIINNQGLKLTGYAADLATGVIVPGNIQPLKVDNNAIPPVATTLSQVQVNLDSRATVPTSGVFSIADVNSYTASTSQTVFDTLGNQHTLSVYYVKTATAGQWDMYTALDADPLSVGAATNLVFSSSGALTTPASGVLLPQSFAVTTGAATPLAFDIDLTGSTQYGIAFGTNQLIQDGYTSGKLSGMSVSPDGIVQGRYSNGKSRNMGQLVLANFNNPNGLQSLGNNQWAETSDSGSPIPGAPGSGNLGLVKSGAVEESNVDMTAELVAMITAQRAYQANAQTIKTQDQVMQTLVNLR
jgi:flagellar hook protein FlgE